MKIETQYKTIGEIKGTNTTRILADTDGILAAIELLSAHVPGAPVVDHRGKYVGYLSEFDILRAIENEMDLKVIKVEDIMNKKLESVTKLTPIEVAVLEMEQKHLVNLPVVSNGYLISTVSRHDLLRAILNVSVGIES